MANFPLSIPELGNKFVDYRDAIPGDSYNWSWIRPLTSVKYLAIHHTAGPDTQTPDEIANYHIQNNGWGGVGYHFIISKNGTVYYVGDINTARANVKDLNDQVIGICLVGDFTIKIPSAEQINSTHILCAKFLFDTPQIPNINGWEDVVGHKQLGSTACPGNTWDLWRGKIVAAGTQVEGNQKRIEDITNLYRTILGREPDKSGLEFWVNSKETIDAIRKVMLESDEHRQMVAKAKNCKDQSNIITEITTALGQLYTRLKGLSG